MSGRHRSPKSKWGAVRSPKPGPGRRRALAVILKVGHCIGHLYQCKISGIIIYKINGLRYRKAGDVLLIAVPCNLICRSVMGLQANPDPPFNGRDPACQPAATSTYPRNQSGRWGRPPNGHARLPSSPTGQGGCRHRPRWLSLITASTVSSLPGNCGRYFSGLKRALGKRGHRTARGELCDFGTRRSTTVRADRLGLYRRLTVGAPRSAHAKGISSRRAGSSD